MLAVPGGRTQMHWDSRDGFVLAFKPAGPGALAVRHLSVIERWPAQAKPLPPRPPAVMALDVSDSTVVTGSKRFTW